ncbi:MAG TPA: HAMP domain-containing sensor histidine kinase [Gaiellaceae bacterium]|nr:HAMP domain-containing sensor histidine kinase [Gaiellaceae bacterium]
MRATGLRLSRLDVAWGVFSIACLGGMLAFPHWETIPFHLIWISLTVLYGFRVWSLPATAAVLIAVGIGTGATIMSDAFDGLQLWGEMFEVPLMSAMFVAMVWHARRRKQALDLADAHAEESARLLEQQERLLQNVSHELRTPVTIARGHLELLQREHGEGARLQVAFEELRRIEQIVDRLLLLARAERDGFLMLEEIPLVAFLEDVFMRWADVAPRAWRLGSIVDVTLTVDATWLRAALDALLENAVQYTDDYAAIALSARGEKNTVVIEVADEGIGVSPEAVEQIFERFARADRSRSRREGGAGLGLAIVDAIARAHDGSVTARPAERGTVFELRLPLAEAANADEREAAGAVSPAAASIGA